MCPDNLPAVPAAARSRSRAAGNGFDAFVERACPGLDLAWRKYRRRAARHAVLARLRELGLEGYDAYLERLQRDPDEAAGLADRMRVTVTRFFRERERWDVLLERVLPALAASLVRPGTLRAWSAGCCGGEEPYTLAILWLDQAASRMPGIALEIVATDIDEASLERARRGIYSAGAMREVPADIRERWFERERAGWRVAEAPRRLVHFESRNLMTDSPPDGMDLVLCRYLAFTYFIGARRHTAAERLWSALRPGGAMMIGRKEGLASPELALFEPWPHAPGIFRRRTAATTVYRGR